MKRAEDQRSPLRRIARPTRTSLRRRLSAAIAIASAIACAPAGARGLGDEPLPPLPAGFDPGPEPPRPPVDRRVRKVQAPAASPDSGTGGPELPAFAGGTGATPTTGLQKKEAAKPTSPTFLNRVFQLDQSPLKIYGWIENSYTYNANGRGDGSNFSVFPNRLANQWQGNQYYLVNEVVTRPDDLSFGFRADILFGNDWLFTKSYGLFDNAFNARNDQFAGIDLPQLYLDSHLPILTRGGIDVRVGRFFNSGGFENVQAIKRPLLSVPYTFNYTPFTFLGALATTHVTDQFNILTGISNGWDRWFDQRYKANLLGGYALTSRDSNTTLNTFFNIGPDQLPRFPPANSAFIPTGLKDIPSLAGQPNPGYATHPRLYFSTTLTHNWSPYLTEALQSDQVLDIKNPGFGPNGGPHNTSYDSLAHWLLRSIDGRPISDSKLTGVWRIEAFQDHNGAATGFPATYFENTLGLIAKPKPWLWVRPEARYDWTAKGSPFSDGTRSSQFTLAFDVIVLF